MNLNPKTPKPHQFVDSNYCVWNAHHEGAACFGGPDDLLARIRHLGRIWTKSQIVRGPNLLSQRRSSRVGGIGRRA